MHYRHYINRDLKSLEPWSPRRKKRASALHWLVAGIVIAGSGAALTLSVDAEATLSGLFQSETAVLSQGGAVELALPAAEPIGETPEAPAAEPAPATETISLALPLPPAPEGSDIAPAAIPASLPKPTATPATKREAPAAASKEEKNAEAPLAQEGPRWHPITIRKGDNLAAIFDRLGADRGDLHRIISLGGSAKELTRIHPGRPLEVKLDTDGRVYGVRYPLDNLRTLLVEGDPKRYQATIDELAVDRHQAFAAATIQNSLYVDAQKAGLPENVIMELANIFGWDIDFALDIRKGDSFSVVYEELHAEGEKIEDGAILAAEFVSQGKSYKAVRYVDPKGASNYFTPEGRSMRKAFLRSPVDFRRISSKFQKERWHPVTGKKRPHRGVDYAAATGTPIKSAGDGKVIFVGHKGGYGKTVVIQHGSQYTTLYAHMNGYKRGIRSGKWVKQGQTIGYVGKTGLATGPHLHYEFRVNGAHRNPLTVKLPKADPIPKEYKADFTKQTQPLMAALELRKSTVLARNDVE